MSQSGYGGNQFGQIANDLRNVAFQFSAAASAAQQFGATVNLFSQFELALVNANIVAEGTTKTLGEMNKAARDFALATKFAASEAANAFYFLASAGLKVEEAMAASTGVLALAQATMTDLGRAADFTAASLQQFGLQSGEALRVANLFVAATNQSQATIEKLEFAFRQVGPVANDANLSIEKTTALLNEMFNRGLRGEQAGTSLRNIIVRLTAPVGEARDILNKLQISTLNATGELRQLDDILREIASKGLSQESLARIAGTEALVGFSALLDAVGDPTKWNAAIAGITGTSDALRQALTQMNTLDGAIKQAANSVNEIRLTFGEGLAPVLMYASDGLANIAINFREMDGASKGLVTQLTAATLGLTLFARTFVFLNGPGGIVNFTKNMRDLVAATQLLGSVNSLSSAAIGLRQFGAAAALAAGSLLGAAGLAAGLAATGYAMYEMYQQYKRAKFEEVAGGIELFADNLERNARRLALITPVNAQTGTGAFNRASGYAGLFVQQQTAFEDIGRQLKENDATLKRVEQQSRDLKVAERIGKILTGSGSTGVLAGSEITNRFGKASLNSVTELRSAIGSLATSRNAALVQIAEDFSKMDDAVVAAIYTKFQSARDRGANPIQALQAGFLNFNDDKLIADSESQALEQRDKLRQEQNRLTQQLERTQQELSKTLLDQIREYATSLAGKSGTENAAAVKAILAQANTSSPLYEITKQFAEESKKTGKYNREELYDALRKALISTGGLTPEEIEKIATDAEVERRRVSVSTLSNQLKRMAQQSAIDAKRALADISLSGVERLNVEIEAVMFERDTRIEALQDKMRSDLAKDLDADVFNMFGEALSGKPFIRKIKDGAGNIQQTVVQLKSDLSNLPDVRAAIVAEMEAYFSKNNKPSINVPVIVQDFVDPLFMAWRGINDEANARIAAERGSFERNAKQAARQIAKISYEVMELAQREVQDAFFSVNPGNRNQQLDVELNRILTDTVRAVQDKRLELYEKARESLKGRGEYTFDMAQQDADAYAQARSDADKYRQQAARDRYATDVANFADGVAEFRTRVQSELRELAVTYAVGIGNAGATLDALIEQQSGSIRSSYGDRIREARRALDEFKQANKGEERARDVEIRVDYTNQLVDALERARDAELAFAASTEGRAQLQRQATQQVLDEYERLNRETGSMADGFKYATRSLAIDLPTNFQIGAEVTRNAINGLSSNFAGLFTGMQDGWKGALANMLSSFSQFVAQILIQKAALAVVGAITGSFGGPLSTVGGNIALNGSVPTGSNVAIPDGAFAKGSAFGRDGVVSSPTAFSYGNGKRGVMGEDGEEAVMPLVRLGNGDLGVRAVAGPSSTTQASGNTLVYQPTFMIDLSGGSDAATPPANSSVNMEAIAKALDAPIRQMVQSVIFEMMRPGNVMSR